jgi:predicted RNA-binding protein
MCESSAYILKDGKEELVMEGVDLLEDNNDQIRLVNLFGEEKNIRARVKRLSLVDHKIILERL